MINILKALFLVVLFSGNVFAQTLTGSVVKLFVTANKMDYYQPWQSQGISAMNGSGVIIKGNKILTSAHVVMDSTFIQVKKDADPKRYTAKVEALGYDCDLALLTVEDPEFFKDATALDFNGLPKLQDKVVVLGYPEGGGQLSITEGVVSRIEVTVYSQSLRSLLTAQIDAAINPGNSGGPVIQDNKIVGIAMQVIQNSQNIGYMVPVPIISHFLKDLEDGKYDGFPFLGIDFNKTENPTLRKVLKINQIEGGIMVSRVAPFSPADGILKEGDVVLEIDGVSVAEDGTYKFRNSERMAMSHLISQKQIGEKINLKIVRDGKIQNLDVPLTSFNGLVPLPDSFVKPPYFIYGGLVFSILSADLFAAMGDNWWQNAPIDFTYYLIGTGRLNEKNKKDIVVLLNVLPSDINVGYHDYGNDIVAKVNGEEIDSFKDFVTTLDKLKKTEPYTMIETQHKYKIILDNKNIDEVNKQILEQNNIPFQYSSDVAEWLKESDKAQSAK